MKEYTIAAIPTLYRGRMYRSRLEARWAAFFDRLGWTHEYEPFDLGKWSPDFAITDPFVVLVEVKPITELDPDIAEKMNAGREGFNLLTRTAPVACDGFVEIGWLTVSYQPIFIAWRRLSDVPRLFADMVGSLYDPEAGEATHWVWASTRKIVPIDEPLHSHGYEDHTMRLWADACNAVQWEPKR